ncbi:hypothetical protein ACWKSP_26210 [Micromonosporaceae bacterium Da 78-11]
MTQVAIHAPNGSPFDQIMEHDTDGTPVWRARQLMVLMGYPRWADFQRVLTRAMTAAKNTEMVVSEVFRASPENPPTQGGRPREDFMLVRDAAYLTALNGDPNKDEVARAQLYFVEQTKKQERADAAQQVVGANTQVDDLALLEGLIQVVRINRQQVAAIQATQTQQAAKQFELAARMDSVESRHDWFAALAYAKLNGLPTDIGSARRLGTAASRLMRNTGQKPAPMQHPIWGTVNTYPIAVLDEAAEILGGAA